MEEVAQATGVPTRVRDSIEAIVDDVIREARAGDHILVMSNGGFGGIHEKLLRGLDVKRAETPVT
jgi:UDP-N-acetylmuramate: L-alanyl-gamma-D-glutamyl-meso-diaminopimelate ligase